MLKQVSIGCMLVILAGQGWAFPPRTKPTAPRPSTTVSVTRPTTQQSDARPVTAVQTVHPAMQVSPLHPSTSVQVTHPTTGVVVNHPQTTSTVRHPETTVQVIHPQTTVEVFHPQTPIDDLDTEVAGAGPQKQMGGRSAPTTMSDFTPMQAKTFTKPADTNKAAPMGGGTLDLGNTTNRAEKDAVNKSSLMGAQQQSAENMEIDPNKSSGIPNLEKIITDRSKWKGKK